MARLSRLCVPGALHIVIQRAHAALSLFDDQTDRQTYLDALRLAAQAHGVQVHAYALMRDQVIWLATPANEPSLGRAVQAMSQRYVAAYNRRHGLRGTRWDGRFRSAALESSTHGVGVCVLVEQWGSAHGATPALDHSSLAHHLGRERVPWLSDPAWYWALGNTPFEREVAWATLVSAATDTGLAQAVTNAANRGWALGSPGFVEAASLRAGRKVNPLARGRPRKKPII